MKKTMYVLCLSLLVCVACSKDEQNLEEQTINETESVTAARGGQSKIMVCHFAKSDDIWEVLEVNSKSLDNHLKHGDAVDMDGDGFFDKANGCSLTDCDDTTYSEINSILTDANIKDAVNLWLSDEESAEAQYGHISNWCTSNVTDMSLLFSNTTSFNEDISAWDVSNVNNMSGLFYFATAFNQDISAWDVSSVTQMTGMFYRATAFNEDISSWDVSNVNNMSGLFYFATAFNQDISAWDVSNVMDMSYMFNSATAFDQDISSWDVSSVIEMGFMFYAATSFNQDLSGWCVSNIASEPALFDFDATAWTDLRPVWGSCPI